MRLQFFSGKILYLIIAANICMFGLFFFLAISKDRKWSRTAWRTSSCRRFYISSLSSSTNVASLRPSPVLNSWSFTPGSVIWRCKYCFTCYTLSHAVSCLAFKYVVYFVRNLHFLQLWSINDYILQYFKFILLKLTIASIVDISKWFLITLSRETVIVVTLKTFACWQDCYYRN